MALDKADMYARLSDAGSTGTGLNAPMRLNATRLGYHGPQVAVTVAGTARHGNVDRESVTIRDQLREEPNTARLIMFGFTPAIDDEIILGAGSLSNRLFRGTIRSIEQTRFKLDQGRVAWTVSAQDWTYQLNRLLVTKRYLSTSATDIAQDLIDTYTNDGFSTSGIASGLASIDEIAFTMTTVGEALSRLADRVGGYWHVDYEKVVHFFISAATAPWPPAETIDSSNRHFALLRHGSDSEQLHNRVYVEGQGSRVLSPIATSETVIPVEASGIFDGSGGTVKADPAQLITYTGVTAGGGEGSSVAHALAAPGAPTATDGTDVGRIVGTYRYKVSLAGKSGQTAPGTASNEVTPDKTYSWVKQWARGQVADSANDWNDCIWSPELELFCAVGWNAAAITEAATSPDGITWTIRTGLPSGNYWGVTWADALSLFVAVGSTASTGIVATSPDGTTWTSRTPSSNERWRAVTWDGTTLVAVAPAGLDDTTLVMTSTDGITWTGRSESHSAGWNRVVWSAADALFVASSSDSGTNEIMTSPDGITWTARTTTTGTFAENGMAHSPELGIFVAIIQGTADTETSPDGVTWTKRSGVLPESTSTWNGLIWAPEAERFIAVNTAGSAGRVATSTDGIAWTAETAASQSKWTALAWSPSLLRAVALAVDSATMTQDVVEAGETVALSSIATGATPTLTRNLWRTKNAGSDYFFLDTIPDNSTATYTDDKIDSELGALAPTESTVAIQVSDTSIQVQELENFASSGWVEVASQIIRYTGRSASSGAGTLTGVPSSGTGSILAVIAGASAVLPLGALTGCSGIATALDAGDEVNILIQRDDASSQSTHGIREHYIQDRRLSQAGAENRADATLSIYADPRTSGDMRSTDPKIASGKKVTFSIYGLSETRVIQSVDISYQADRPLPIRSLRFSSRTALDFFAELRAIRAQSRGH